jgi:hypothetical protein
MYIQYLNIIYTYLELYIILILYNLINSLNCACTLICFYFKFNILQQIYNAMHYIDCPSWKYQIVLYMGST